MPDFNYDIYISFSPKDNEAPHGAIGWVSNFQRFLKILLEQILGETPNFLFYNTTEKPSISEVNKCGVFIALLSPEYIKSKDNLEELNGFYENAIANNNISIKNTTRLLKVLKFPVEPNVEPQVTKGLLGYDLFYTNEVTGELSEFHDFFNLDAERNYWLKLVDLAYDVASLIKNFRNLDITTGNMPAENNIVYLAETGADLKLHRDNIKRDLIRHGFKILPDKPLPINATEIEVAVKKDLESSRLSIHLIGDSYGEIPTGSEKSILDIQNKLAGEHSQLVTATNGDGDKKFTRLIWISPSAQLVNDKQRIFVDNLRRELEDNEGAEIHQSPIEDLKMTILEELLGLNLDKVRRQIAKQNLSNANLQKLYFIYDKMDEYEAKKILENIDQQKFDIIPSSFDGDLLKLREIHNNNLKICDIGIIFANNVNDIWLQMKYSDLLKAPGLGRNKGEIKKYVLLGKKATDKADLTNKYDAAIMQLNDNNIIEINNFLNQ
ncbi:MAG: hypothetical protein NW207_09265 [Cytophagales bacterium]|nr:hypothetical protein [Cytophagales bacterium]